MGYKPMQISDLSAPGLKKQILSQVQCESISGKAIALDVSYDELFSANPDYAEVIDCALAVAGDVDSF